MPGSWDVGDTGLVPVQPGTDLCQQLLHPARLLSTPSLSSSQSARSQPVGLLTGLPPHALWVLQAAFYSAAGAIFLGGKLTMPVPFCACSWSEPHSSPCHSRPFLVEVNAIRSHWFLLCTLLPSSLMGFFSIPMQLAVLPHVAFAHRRPLPGAAPLPSLLVQMLLVLKPLLKWRFQGKALTGLKSDQPPRPPCVGLMLRWSTFYCRHL